MKKAVPLGCFSNGFIQVYPLASNGCRDFAKNLFAAPNIAQAPRTD